MFDGPRPWVTTQRGVWLAQLPDSSLDVLPDVGGYLARELAYCSIKRIPEIRTQLSRLTIPTLVPVFWRKLGAQERSHVHAREQEDGHAP
jgi:hypothetical protein